MKDVIPALCRFLMQNGVIDEDDRELYEYCFSVLFLNLFYYAICFGWMLYYHSFLRPTLFLVAFLLLRSLMGGWHAPSMGSCLLIGLLMFSVSVNILLYPGISAQEKILFSVCSMTLTTALVFRFGIAHNPNRPLTPTEQQNASAFCRRFLVLLDITLSVLLVYRIDDYVFSIGLAAAVVSLLFIPTQLPKKGR